jgi:lipase
MPPTPVESHLFVNGVELAVYEWPGAGRPVLFCHATGFHARIWDQVIAHFRELGCENRCIAFDARGHGRSGKPAPPYHWRDLGADMAALAEALGMESAVGVGHSLGGHSVTLAAALRPDAFGALVLLDPVIRPASDYTGRWDQSHIVRKRRNQWTSPEEMFQRFENRPPFASWDRRVLRDYCDYALRANGDGLVLACPPEIEASIYEHSRVLESNIYAEIARLQVPVHVVRGGFDDEAHFMAKTLTSPDLAASFARGRDTLLAEHSHFIPMEAPALTARFIAESLRLL